MLIATLGTMSLCQALFELVFSTDTKSLREGPLPSFSAGGLTISILHIAILIVVRNNQLNSSAYQLVRKGRKLGHVTCGPAPQNLKIPAFEIPETGQGRN